MKRVPIIDKLATRFYDTKLSHCFEKTKSLTDILLIVLRVSTLFKLNTKKINMLFPVILFTSKLAVKS